jgi:hypothetical protein
MATNFQTDVPNGILPTFGARLQNIPASAFPSRSSNIGSFDGIPAGGPPKASAAPKPSNNTVGSGLVAALNNYQLTLLNNKGSDGNPNPLIQVPDEYEIKFFQF